ncbi:LysM peptidoglycan-binding domain-containing protein [Vibrio paucivorans]|uniref:LysM peptidoglycan-binding domain-containing protein n=1 Tax=Vibrio paucivorans TaxID=2829489 RepID=A0A9X3HV25_9VIBR|nr:LysM domain-containing protein [Vibrio paucivorans]MCW8336717.1 LysM peptidoglycan-binding domain-containing protein [Vibrio paucivorans]
MNFKRITLSMAVLSLVSIAGCASNDELIATQEQQQQQITQLQSQIERVEQKTQQQEQAIQSASQKARVALAEQAAIKEQESRHYVIKENDTLYSIAKEYQMTIDALMQLNTQISNPKRLLIGSTIRVK